MMDRRRYRLSSFAVATALLATIFSQGCGTPMRGPEKGAEETASPRRDLSDAKTRAAQGFDARLLASEAVDGSVMVATVTVPAGKLMAEGTPMGEYEGVKFPFFEVSASEGRTFEAVFAVPFNHKPVPTLVKISFGGEMIELPLTVKDGQYPSEKLKVEARKVNPRKSDMARIFREQAEVKAIYENITQKKYWKGPFVLPIESKVTSIFGTKRVFNGEMKSYHGGLDLRAKKGTPIYAPAAGVVVLAKNLFFSGKTVLIDHGYGVVTLYAHMSRFKVKTGQQVDTRTLLGLSGATGRVSGPHLHWQAVIYRNKVNPIDLTRVMR